MAPDPRDPIDLLHRGLERGVACYLVETDDGLALHDCGPASTLPVLRAALAERDLGFEDIRHLLLSHIHFDHAGAAGAIVRESPAIQVHVSSVGAPHLIDPSRLEASARRLWDDFDTLWGAVTPIPQENVHLVGDRVCGLECFPSPGHARHHVSYLHEDGTLYAGDSLGVRITPGRYVIPPTPPPDIDLDGWELTIDESLRRRPTRLALTHFGVFDEPEDHIDRFRRELELWGRRVEEGMDEATFTELARGELHASDPDLVDMYENAATIANCHSGILRYWTKRREAADAGAA
jgi:glyoxylase-like metal-dependent hydrolase (beta-lactamase superfamily II)